MTEAVVFLLAPGLPEREDPAARARRARRRPRGRRPGWGAVRLGALVLVGLFLASVLALGPGASSAASVETAHSPTSGSPLVLPNAFPTPPAAGIPGQDSRGEPIADPVSAVRTLERAPFLIAPPAPNASIALDWAQGRDLPIHHVLAPPAAPTPFISSVGYVDGEIVSATAPHLPVAGATVLVAPVAGFCPAGGCVPGVTAANGTFEITAASGENTVLVSANYYVTNRSWVNVTDGGLTNVGSIELVADGSVTGVLLSDDAGHEPIGGINMTAVSRDGTYEAMPFAVTLANGSFTLPVPPVPSQLNFNPPYNSPYLANLTYVNASAGATLEIGPVYLEHLSPINVTLVNSVTGQPLSGDTAMLQVCSKVSGACGTANNSVTNPTGSIDAFAPVGPDSVTVGAPGYVANSTSLGYVPTSPLVGPPKAMGVIDLVPDGVLALEINITGIPAPYNVSVPTSLWPVGKAWVMVCSLDGVSSILTSEIPAWSSQCIGICVPPGVPFEIPATPLRDFIAVGPDTASECGFPDPLWPTPPDMPVYGNWAWVNVTSGHLLNAGSIDLWPGTYVEGQVFPKSITNWVANICSTDEPNECFPAVPSDAGFVGGVPTVMPPPDCPSESSPSGGYTFCAPAPPGPVQIVVSSANSSSNFTWGVVPTLTWSQNPLPLSVATDPSVGAIWLQQADVTGRIEAAGSYDPLPFAALTVCPAGQPSAANQCGVDAANATGDFESPAPIGWDQISFSASGYEPNSSWLLVDRNNSTGTLLLTPEAFLQGQVVGSNGVGLYSATVQTCPASDPTDCSLLGQDGVTSTDGHYFGTIVPGPPPIGTYEIEASAPGYATEWTWVNVSTPGATVTAPTLVLASLGSPFHPATPKQPTVSRAVAPGAWVTGRVVDAEGGVGLPQSALNATGAVGGTVIPFIASQATGGEFNDSVPAGAYYIEVSETGFFPTSVFVNITGSSQVVSVGTIELQPYPTLTGRVVIDPGSWRAGVTYAYGLGVPAYVTACERTGSPCSYGLTDSAGDFNISAPPGTYDQLNITPIGSGAGSFPGGFLENQTYVDVANSSGNTGPTPLVGLDIFGVVTGRLTASNASGGGPVRYDSVSFSSHTAIDTNGPAANESGGVQGNASGSFVMIFPPSGVLWAVAGGSSAWVPSGADYTGHEPGPGGSDTYALGAGDSLAIGAGFSLAHYGWVTMQVTNSATGNPVPYASLTAEEPGTLNGTPTEFTSTGVANSLGYVNMTAPPSIPSNRSVSLNLSAPDYLYQHFSVLVNSSETTVVNTSVGHGGVDLRPWGWVAGLVVDAVTGSPVTNVAVQSGGPAYQQGRTGIYTNGAGAYLTDAPVAPNDTVSFERPGYSSNLSSYPVYPGEFLEAATLALTGDGTVEGRVVALPSGTPVYDATVGACPMGQAYCSAQVATNASGIFVVDAPVGVDEISVSAPGFAVPGPAYVTVGSDQWYWVGAVGVEEYAQVVGEVLAIPGGLPVVGATVTLCPMAVAGYGGTCFDTVETGSNGSFFLSGPAGTYVLEASAPFYNTTSLPIALAAGETVRVGAVFLFEFGVGTGLVEGSPTGVPVGGATVSACESWGAHTCQGPVTTGSNGRYAVSGPAGPYVLTLLAPGYQTGFDSISLVSGSTVPVPPILLIPIGPGNQYLVSGYVESAGPSLTPLAGAVVSAPSGGATDTSASGAYSFRLAWGLYTLSAALPGYVTGHVTLNVTEPVTDLNFSLAVVTYAVTGSVRDGLSGQALEGVQLDENGQPVGAPSGENGSFSLLLSNGTHAVVATDLNAPTQYVPVPFDVTVTGAPLVRDLSMYPPAVAVDGLVANALTGQPIAGATVTISGVTSDGPTWSATVASDPVGRFVVNSYPGTYHLEANDPGFLGTNSSLTLGAEPSTPVTVVLTPVPSGGSPSAGSPLWLVGVVVGAAVIAGVGVAAQRRRAP